MGPFIKDVRKIFGILDPLPPGRILARSIVVNPPNLPYYVCFWATPLPPPGADVLYVWSLIEFYCGCFAVSFELADPSRPGC